jgi:hypothetical protein
MKAGGETLSVSVACTREKAYAFLSNPENLPQWAPAFCKSVRKSGVDWIVATSQGDMKFRFVESNPFGVLDHYIRPSPGVEIYVPMRVVANPTGGSDVMLTLFCQSGMSEEQFQNDIAMVQRDLKTLKCALEK